VTSRWTLWLLLGLTEFAIGGDRSSAGLCAQIADDTSRLACYDAAFKSAESPRRVQAKIVSATALAGERYRLELDNGQIWETKEGSWNASFAVGQDVTIDRGFSNAYRVARVGEGRFFAAKRIK
jgi:hypothetical protein